MILVKCNFSKCQFAFETDSNPVDSVPYYMKKCLFIIILFACIITKLHSQNQHSNSIENLIEDILVQMTEENEDETDYSEYYDDLIALSQNPLNLNQATQNQLKDLFFLSDIQIENILYYIYQFGTMQTIYELRLIDGLDERDIRRMLPFVYVTEEKRRSEKLYWREIWKYGKNNVYLRFDQNLEKSKGYILDKDGATKYAGSPFYHSLKHQFQYRNRVLFGITAEKDAGEQFLSNKKGYDFFSAYVQLNEIGKFKTIVLGDFRANFGEGLVLRTNFTMGKSSQALNVNQTKAGLRKSSSTDEYNFFRGVGATVRLGNFDVSAFYSNKNIDGDTIGSVFPSISKTGLHRTESEIRKKRAVNQQLVGGNLTFTQRYYQIGFTAAHTLLSHSLEPEAAVYNAHYFSGKTQTTAGIHYRLRWHKLNFFGETAISDKLAFATTNGLSFMPLSRVGLIALFRYFSPEYDTFYANAFSESSTRTNNETGFYLGTEIHPMRRWKISAYADGARFPWLKYGVSSPSSAADYMLNADFAVRRTLSMSWRLNYKQKEVNNTNSDAPLASVIPHEKLSLRYALNSTFGNFRFQTMLNGNIVRKSDSDWTYGLAALQDVSYSFRKIPLQIDFRFQFFDAEDYENRIYFYEKDILYAFSIPMNYGIGSRYYLNLKYDLRKDISLWFKFAQTVYADDREKIGSGNDEIEGNRKTTIRFLLKWKF